MKPPPVDQALRDEINDVTSALGPPSNTDPQVVLRRLRAMVPRVDASGDLAASHSLGDAIKACAAFGADLAVD